MIGLSILYEDILLLPVVTKLTKVSLILPIIIPLRRASFLSFFQLSDNKSNTILSPLMIPRTQINYVLDHDWMEDGEMADDFPEPEPTTDR